MLLEVSIKKLILRIEKELSEINSLLDELNDDNFSDKFSRINFLIDDIESLRQKMLNEFPLEDLKKNEKKINLLTKQIKIKLDNIFVEKKKESEEIKKKLNFVQNQKKISNYRKV